MFDAIREIIDEAIVKRRTKLQQRDYLGASVIGHECLRQVQFYYTHGSHAKTNARQLRTFDIGSSLEFLCAHWLREAGFDLITADDRGNQASFVTANGKISGHADGIIYNLGELIKIPSEIEIKTVEGILGIAECKHTSETIKGTPEAFKWLLSHKNTPVLWENKTMNQSSFLEVTKHGVFASRFTYYVQVQLYMAYMSLEMCLFTVLNKNTSEMYFELIPFDAEVAQRYSDRAAEIIKASENNELLPAICETHTYFACKVCPFQELCKKYQGKTMLNCENNAITSDVNSCHGLLIENAPFSPAGQAIATEPLIQEAMR